MSLRTTSFYDRKKVDAYVGCSLGRACVFQQWLNIKLIEEYPHDNINRYTAVECFENTRCVFCIGCSAIAQPVSEPYIQLSLTQHRLVFKNSSAGIIPETNNDVVVVYTEKEKSIVYFMVNDTTQ